MLSKSVCYVVLALGLVTMVACASTESEHMPGTDKSCSISSFHFDQCQKLALNNRYLRKVDNFIIVFDSSASMLQLYKGQIKFELARSIALCMNRTIPDLKLAVGLMTFGSPVYTSMCYGMTRYSRTGLCDALMALKKPSGVSPLSFAFDALEKDLWNIKGKTAVIVISDGVDMNIDPVLEVRKIKSEMGNNICVYTILIGDDPNGKGILNQIALSGICGFSTTADELASVQGMADFVKKVFLLYDTDGDGVADSMDQCPDTPKEATVDKQGCWVIKDVLFDFDSHDIRPDAYPILDNVAHVMELNPDITIEIDGHTDIIGPERYNDMLSINRARSGMNYLIHKGISRKRITIRGFGFSRPKTTNRTPEGRAKNRRIELLPSRR